MFPSRNAGQCFVTPTHPGNEEDEESGTIFAIKRKCNFANNKIFILLRIQTIAFTQGEGMNNNA